MTKMKVKMKYLAKIQSEFLKEARNWDDLSIEEQKAYLQRHPKSKRKLTAKPESLQENSNDIEKLNKEAIKFADAPLHWISSKTKADLLPLKEKLSKEQSQMNDDDSRFETYGNALANISKALYNKGGKKNRHKPTSGPGIMPVWMGGKQIR